jgi:hypothetical protein
MFAVTGISRIQRCILLLKEGKLFRESIRYNA